MNEGREQMAYIGEPFLFTIIKTMAPQNKSACQLRIFAMGKNQDYYSYFQYNQKY